VTPARASVPTHSRSNRVAAMIMAPILAISAVTFVFRIDAAADPGQLDSSTADRAPFGTTGTVLTQFGTGTTDFGEAIVEQPDGKYVVAGSSQPSGGFSSFALARYNTDGSLDTSFGSGGKVTTSFPNDRGDSWHAVTLDSVGRIIVAGRQFIENQAGTGGTGYVAVARYNSAGTLDTSFDTGTSSTPAGNTTGVFRYAPSGDDAGNAVFVDGSGNIVVGGFDINGWFIMRLTPAGVFDTTFSPNGIPVGVSAPTTQTSAKGSEEIYWQGQGLDEINAMVDDGSTYTLAGTETNNAGALSDFAIARITTTGALDSTFNTGFSPAGMGHLDFSGGNDKVFAMVKDSGKYVLAGQGGTGVDFALARYSSTGGLDTTFNSTGHQLTDLGSTDDEAHGIAVESDGKYVVSGFKNTSTGHDVAVARYTSAGALDTGTFNSTTGYATKDVQSNSNDEIEGMVLDPGTLGKIVVAGWSQPSSGGEFLLQRWFAAYPPTVSTQPASVTVCVGGGATFTSAASDTRDNPAPSQTQQWQVSTDGGTTWSDIGGATSGTLSFSTTTPSMNGNKYRDTFTNSGGTTDSNAATLTVDLPPSLTQNPSNDIVWVGDTASFTATATGRPTPTVQWQVSTDNGTSFSNASGTSSTTSPYTFTAALAQNGNQYRALFSNHCGTALTSAAMLTVDQPTTSTAVSSSANPSAFGQSVSFTATVTKNVGPPGSGSPHESIGTPSGTVSFFLDGSTTAFDTETLSWNSTLDHGTATSTGLSNLSVADHTITATYSGDTLFVTSTSSSFTQHVVKADTTTTVTPSAPTTVYGQAQSFDANVTANSPGAGTPTGTVQFTLDGSNTGSPATMSGGSAATSLNNVTVGTHHVGAAYGGDSDFAVSTATTTSTWTVDQASTTTSLVTSGSPADAGTTVSFTSTTTVVAPGAGTPTGNVEFFLDGSTTAAFTTSIQSDGTAVWSTSSLPVGTHTVTATYVGDTNFHTSSSAGVTQVINPIPTTTVVTTSDPNAVSGEQLTFTATVTPGHGTGTPGGTVTFVFDGHPVGPVTMSGGQASLSGVTLPADGSPHTVSAFYSGDSVYSSSSGTYSQTVVPDTTTTTIKSSVNPSVYGQGVSFTAAVAPDAPGTGFPTGTVTFIVDGATPGTTVALTLGHATLGPISNLSVGGHTIEADYNGDTNYSASIGNLTQIVNPDASTTVVTSDVNPSVTGQTVTFTATVSASAPGSGSPTGSVQFMIDGTDFGSPVALTGNSASITDSALAVGGRTVVGHYGGDTNFNAGDSAAYTQTVNKADTTTATVVATPTSSVYGQSVHLSTQVSASAPGAGTPTGMVTFLVDGSPVGSQTLASDGSAGVDVSTIAAGSHSITASYAGDGGFNGSISNELSFTVSAADTTTTIVTSSDNPSVYGETVSFTATVVPNAPGAGTPTGTVTFSVDGGAFATVALSGGSATAATFALTPGNRSITAAYTPDTTNYNGSTTGTAFIQTVNRAATSTSVFGSVNPSVTDQSVTFTATVTPVAPGAGTPTGTATFVIDGLSPVTIALDGAGQAAYTTSFDAGTHSIVVTYSGDGDFAGSSGSVSQLVDKADTMTSLQSNPNPSVFGQLVTYTAHVIVNFTDPRVPTGSVQLMADGVPLGSPVTLDASGSASLTDGSLGVGTHHITAVYSGDPNLNTSTSSTVMQEVDKADTTAVITNPINPSVFGQTVVFTATVTASAPGVGTPSGTVLFEDNGVVLDTEVLNSGGQAFFTTGALTVGNHPMTAVYLGDTNFNASPASSTLTQTVNKADTSSSVSSLPNPSLVTQSVTFTDIVTAVAPGGGIPSGNVTWSIGSSTYVVPLDSTGTSSVSVAFSSAANVAVSASYAGSDSYNGSAASLAGGQTVNRSPTTTTLSSSANPSVFGQPVTLKAHVTSQVGLTPTGAVSFVFDGVAYSFVNLDGSGNASFNVPPSHLTVGTHNASASYSGDTTQFLGSQDSLTQQVNQPIPVVTLTSTSNPSTFGQSVTFNVTVAAQSPATGTPTGTVTFDVCAASCTPVTQGTMWAGPTTLSGGSASFSTNALPPGTMDIQVHYGGDTNFKPADSNILAQTVRFTSSCVTSVKSGLTVNAGQALCVAGTSKSFASVRGGITVKPGGALFLSFASVQGGIVSTGATYFRMCHSTSGSGSVSVTGSTGPVVIGDAGDDGTPICGTDTVSGGMTVSGNTGGVEIGTVTVSGGLTVNNNSGTPSPDGSSMPSATEIEGNTISGGLFCSGNSPAPTDDSHVNSVTSGPRTGQCSSSTF
jgi:uncharacterized delta-60 repeat protein